MAAKATNQSITTYSPIACALFTIDRTVKERMIKKFDICFVIAKEGLAFRKYPSLHELEVRHGVDLSFSYKTKTSAAAFTHYIAKSHQQLFVQSVSAVSFYSILIDGSTDAGNVEDELVAILYCSKDDVNEEQRTCVRYFSLQRLMHRA